MHEVTEKLDGISILVGTAACNAHCPQCAGVQHRCNAPRRDGEFDEGRLRQALEYCRERDCRYVTLTGCGEPTLSPISVTKTLEVITDFAEHGYLFAPVNLYTNGIRIGSDATFCLNYLPLWSSLGLTDVYVSAYCTDEKRNAAAFGVQRYPRFSTIFGRLRDAGLLIRVSIILKKGYIDNRGAFAGACETFFRMGVHKIGSWPVKDENDFISPLAPDRETLEDIRRFVEENPALPIRLLLGDAAHQDQLGKKVALFQNGEISNVWCARK